jgi:argininosuccinate lyase
MLGAPLQYQDEEIARITSPRHFVEVRRTPGGPAPAETTRAIALSRDVLGRDRAWLDKTHEALRDADARRRQRSEVL